MPRSLGGGVGESFPELKQVMRYGTRIGLGARTLPCIIEIHQLAEINSLSCNGEREPCRGEMHAGGLRGGSIQSHQGRASPYGGNTVLQLLLGYSR